MPFRLSGMINVVLSVLILGGTLFHLASALDPEEIQALQDMQAEWNLTSWTGPPSCSWLGITCDANSHIVSIDLPGSQLTGTIPTSIAQLLYLYNLDLSGNYLVGSIPSAFGNITFLSSAPEYCYLRLNNNQLGGIIPETISNFFRGGNRCYLMLNSNNLQGTIPDIGSAPLGWINLGFNRLTGSAPSLSRLGTLYQLNLNDNILSGAIPNNYFQTNSNGIGGLYLQNNFFTEITGILHTFNINSFFAQIDLSGNLLTGQLPDMICLPYYDQPQFLNSLNLANNLFSGTIPSFTGCSSLQFLSLSNNELSGPLPSSIGSLVSLTDLYVLITFLLHSIFGLTLTNAFH